VAAVEAAAVAHSGVRATGTAMIAAPTILPAGTAATSAELPIAAVEAVVVGIIRAAVVATAEGVAVTVAAAAADISLAMVAAVVATEGEVGVTEAAAAVR
jgi:hypothetical protein